MVDMQSLSSREHDELRRTIDSGIDRLDRRRRRRNVVGSGVVAFALIAGISASAFAVGVLRPEPAPVATVSPTPSPTSPSPVPTSPSPTPSEPSATPTAPPTPTENPIADDDPSGWIVSDQGIGPFLVGSPIAEAAGSLPEAHTCRPEGGAYLGLEDRLWLVPTREDPAVVGTVAWLRYNEDTPESARGPRTREGIGLGSTVAEVRAAYPRAVDVSTNGDYLLIGNIYFDVTRGVVDGLGVTSDEVPWEYCG